MSKLFWTVIGLMALVALGYFVSIPLPPELSYQVAAAIIILMFTTSILPGQMWRSVFLTLAAFIVVRYIVWRFVSLPLEGEFADVFVLVLLSAEVFGVSQLLLGLFVNAHPLDRKPVPLPADKEEWPTVDVYIPTYSEPIEIVASTMMGALNIDYPADKIRVYVCDDGYPRSLHAPGALGIELTERSERLRELCERHGANYVTRHNNKHAKSGNLNNAMSLSMGELILVLDADHIPTRDILKNTTGLFLKDPKLAFVQTPHFFVTGDPVERNLNLMDKMPAENDMFYRVVQKGLDLWNTSFFCGSAAVLRRKAIQDVGGFSTTSITEDASTSVSLHSRGWRSAYIAKPMVAGLNPDSFSAFIVQRLRWAMGMIQIFMLQNPLAVKGLSLGQRLSYLSVVSFWLFPFARVVFFISPILSIMLYIKVYPSSMDLFVSYTVPYVITVILTFQKMFGRVRRILISELYETIQSFFSLPAILATVASPTKPTFKVTPKGERTDVEYISDLAGPFYVMYALTFIAFIYGIYRLYTDPMNADTVVLSLAWVIFNMLLLNGALGVLVEQVQRRARPRINIDERVTIEVDGIPRHAVVVDANENGALVSIPGRDMVPHFMLKTKAGDIPCRVLEYRWDMRKPDLHPVVMEPVTPEQERACVELAFGSSARWEQIWALRENNTPALMLFTNFVSIGIKTALRHYSTRQRLST